eukprot:scaffold8662_cov145-Skeletonema_marinoi.AAC.1
MASYGHDSILGTILTSAVHEILLCEYSGKIKSRSATSKIMLSSAPESSKITRGRVLPLCVLVKKVDRTTVFNPSPVTTLWRSEA